MTTPLLLDEEPISGAGKEELGSIENDFAYRNNVVNANIKIRMAFIRKVYGLLGTQLMITTAISAVFMLCKPVQEFVQTNVWIIGILFISTIFLLIPLHLKRRDHPVNLILLCSFTSVQAVTVGFVVSMYDASVVLQALFITLAAVIGLTAFTFQTKRDFSFFGAGLFAGLCVLIVTGIIQIFVHNSALDLAVGIAGALLFSLYIVYDTQLLLQKLSPEEYVLATINLYLDILNLFLQILHILAASRK